MFIQVRYKDMPELSSMRRDSRRDSRRNSQSESVELDTSLEKTVLVNPDCPVRIMLEYLRKKCKLGIFTNFDLCDEHGVLKGLFDMPTYAYATNKFYHTKTYFLVVLKAEPEGALSIFPQVNCDNPLYEDLKAKILKFLETGASSLSSSSTRTLGRMAQSKTTQKSKSPPAPKKKK